MENTGKAKLPLGLPKYVYFGSQWLRRRKLYALPPTTLEYPPSCPTDTHLETPCGHLEWEPVCGPQCRWHMPDSIKPYSIRSFVLQMREAGSLECVYFHEVKAVNIYRTPFYADLCLTGQNSEGCPLHWKNDPCYLVTGRIEMLKHCPSWANLARMCDSPPEVKLLLKYLQQNADRESPMLIPQVWMGEAEKFRVDFAAFLPTAEGYRKIAIECQSFEHHFGQDTEKAKKVILRDAKRKRYLMQIGYEVIEFWADEINDDDGSNCARELRAFMKLS